MTFQLIEGNYSQLGTTAKKNGAEFTFAGEREDDCKLLLKDKKTGQTTLVPLPEEYCRGSLRSVLVTGFEPKNYTYRYILNDEEIPDPYARVICGRETWMDLTRKDRDYCLENGFLCDAFSWDQDIQPEIPRESMVMYKLHVRGFSMDKGASKRKAGTFAGLAERIPYLKNLGITTLELMPAYEFEEMTIPPKHRLPDYVKWVSEDKDLIEPVKEEIPQKVNFWGYGPGNYFAVKASYASVPEKASEEFKGLVKQLHENGMELVMEIYFPRQTNPHLIMDALRYWVLEYHVDGFHLQGDNLPIETLASDALLSRTKLFYLDFSDSALTSRRRENLFVYKDEYQYPAKKILNHMNADMTEFFSQQKKQGQRQGFVNYITGNNGFTLCDLFMYNDRHNEANGENNTDGNPWNFSNNQGVEGPSRKKSVLLARKRQWKNAFLMLLTAQAVPLIWSGDEFENSQSGNNNAYCQDNEIGWINWKKNKAADQDIAFVTDLIAFRRNHPVLSNPKPFTFSDYKALGAPDFSVHGEYAWIGQINPGSLAVGFYYSGAYSPEEDKKEDVYIGYNFFSGRSTLALPKLSDKKKWYLAVNSNDSDTGFYPAPLELKKQQTYEMDPLSICILIGK